MSEQVATIDAHIVTYVDHRNFENFKQPLIEVKVFTDYKDADDETTELFQRAFDDCFRSCADIRVIRCGWEQVSIFDNTTGQVLITIKIEKTQIAHFLCGTMSM